MRQNGTTTAPSFRPPRNAAALLASVVVHVVIFTLLFAKASGSLMSSTAASGGPTGPAFNAILVRLETGPTTAQAAPPTGAQQALQMRIRVENDSRGIPMEAKTSQSRFAALVDRLTSTDRTDPSHTLSPRPARVEPQGTRAPRDSPLLRTMKANSHEAENAQGDAVANSTGRLWGAMEPCWRNLSFRGQLPVTLEVDIAQTGRLASPPRVVRSDDALLSEARLRSEANALAALAACLPRRSIQMARTKYMLSFPASQ